MPYKVLYATIKPAPGQEKPIKDAMIAVATESRKEPGNIRYEVYQLDNGDFHIEESYKDEAAFETHKASAHFENFKASIIDKIAPNGLNIVFLKSVATTH